MMRDAYIGYVDHDQDFKWEGGNWNGNIPKRQSPFFPGGGFRMIKERIASGKYEGKQTDWGAWVAIVNKKKSGKSGDTLLNSFTTSRHLISAISFVAVANI